MKPQKRANKWAETWDGFKIETLRKVKDKELRGRVTSREKRQRAIRDSADLPSGEDLEW